MYEQNGIRLMETDNIITVLSKMLAIALKYVMLNDEAMNSMHLLGYNGFKRWHRIKTKEFLCYSIEIENDTIDKYRKKLDVDIVNIDYKPMSLKEHLSNLDNILLEDIKQLGILLNEYRGFVGKGYCVAEEMLSCLVKSYEKTGRWLKRFEETQWMGHDIHVLDDALHSKMKEIEGK